VASYKREYPDVSVALRDKVKSGVWVA